MIEFTCYTKVSPARHVAETFPRYVYRLTPFAELPKYAGENKHFLGQYHHCPNLNTFLLFLLYKTDRENEYIHTHKHLADVLGLISEVSETTLLQLPNQSSATLNRNIILKDLR